MVDWPPARKLSRLPPGRYKAALASSACTSATIASCVGAGTPFRRLARTTLPEIVPVESDEQNEAVCMADKRDNTVVVISSDRMGEGNDELGKVLIKGFIYAITQLETLPKTVIFYNGGATIPVEGSVSLEDLKNLEAQGVEIITCGTCLDYYNLKEKLAVGSVTNMYTIVEKMSKASCIIKP